MILPSLSPPILIQDWILLAYYAYFDLEIGKNCLYEHVTGAWNFKNTSKAHPNLTKQVG